MGYKGKIKAIRELKNISQAEFAKLCNISQADVSRLESGAKRNVPIEVIRYMQQNRINLNWFFAEESTEDEQPMLLSGDVTNERDILVSLVKATFDASKSVGIDELKNYLEDLKQLKKTHSRNK